MLYVARRIDNPLGQFLRLSMPLRNLDVIKRDFQIGILQTLSIVFIIILILSYVLSGKFSRPLKSLSHAAEQVTKGDLNVKVHILTGDELESVGNSFNKMIGQVKENLYSIEQQKAELSEIISSLSEVLWVIDKTGNIVISNPGFSKTFHLAGKTEEAYWHLIKDAEVLELIGETLSTKQNIIKTVSINDKDFILSSSYLDRYERAIFIMQNVSELKQVQRMKQDFIVNMAHELRTPITAIKGFAEMLESSVPEDKKRFLTIIRNHSDRLANLVEDIQMLINLEQIGKLDIEHIHLRKFAENIRQLYEARFNELGINFQLEIDDSITNFYGDIFKLDQIFINLIDNALRYTSEGYIKLSIERKNNFIGFKVTDTGCGIENKHLDRLFERFYVADKARSRKMGGTGLGLAIVKHIVMLHHGTVSVESEVGKGTCFTINLPLDLNEN
jgi:two-component system phosphate regulon sensor histidine kinase PhoR